MKVFSYITMAAVMMATRCYGLQILSENMETGATLGRLSDYEYEQLVAGGVDAERHLGKVYVHRAGGIPDEEFSELEGHLSRYTSDVGSYDDRVRAFVSQVGSRLVDFKGITKRYPLPDYVMANFVQQFILDRDYSILMLVCELQIDVDWNIPLKTIGSQILGVFALTLLIQEQWLLGNIRSSVEEVHRHDTTAAAVVKLKKNLANKIFGYLARCEFWAKKGLRFWILVG